MIDPIDALKLFGGLVYLLVGGDVLVRGALGFSARSRIPPMVVGLTVVAAGTSAPELLVSVVATLSGHPGIAVGNVVGSNVANVLLVLGVPVLIHSMVVDDDEMGLQAAYMVGVSALFVALCFFEPLGFGDGLLMLALFAAGAWSTLRGHISLPGLSAEEAGEELERGLGLPHHGWSIALLIGFGTIALPVGAHLTVEGAEALAKGLGISEAAIAASIIALGTSLPELSTTVIAARHHSSGVALGNVIGSNVMNILGIMGVTAVLAPVAVPASFLRGDLWVMLGAAVLLWWFVAWRRRIGRAAGSMLLVGYVAYLVLTFQH